MTTTDNRSFEDEGAKEWSNSHKDADDSSEAQFKSAHQEEEEDAEGEDASTSDGALDNWSDRPEKSIVGDDELESTALVTEQGDKTLAFQAVSEGAGEFADEPVFKARESFKSFTEAGLGPKLLMAIKKQNWSAPTPIQSLCLPHTLKGKDLAGFAQTGTGKTGVFLITLGHFLIDKQRSSKQRGKPFALVLTPTRELAIQIEEECRKLLGHLQINSMAVFGGMNWEGQAKQLRQSVVDVIIATPGRLRDYFEKNIISLEEVNLFVCDEADRMFDMGFIEDVEYFLRKLTSDAQKLLFSATTNARVKELAYKYLNEPIYLSVNPQEITPENISQHALLCTTPEKFKLLLSLLQEHQPERAMIFANTKIAAQWLHYKLNGNGIEADIITGDLPQTKRIKLIKDIKSGKTKILIATDVASRGLDITGVTHVYNFDIPDDPANYVHRIGRTARAGAKGASYSLLCDEYASNFLAVQDILGKNCPQAVWPEKTFLEVEDKAGNPFEDPESLLSRDMMRDPGRDEQRRGGRHDRREGGGRSAAPSYRDDRERRDERERSAHGHHPRKYGNRPMPQDGDRRGGMSRRSSQAHGQAYRHHRDRDDFRRGRRPGHDYQHKHQHEPAAATTAKMAAKTDKASLSIFGILKRFVSLLLGKGKSKPQD